MNINTEMWLSHFFFTNYLLIKLFKGVIFESAKNESIYTNLAPLELKKEGHTDAEKTGGALCTLQEKSGLGCIVLNDQQG